MMKRVISTHFLGDKHVVENCILFILTMGHLMQVQNYNLAAVKLAKRIVGVHKV